MHTIVVHLGVATLAAPISFKTCAVAATRTSMSSAQGLGLALVAIIIIFVAAIVSVARAVAELLNYLLQISAKLSSILLTMAVLAALALVLLLHL